MLYPFTKPVFESEYQHNKAQAFTSSNRICRQKVFLSSVNSFAFLPSSSQTTSGWLVSPYFRNS